jgi:hypothetical protein
MFLSFSFVFRSLLYVDAFPIYLFFFALKITAKTCAMSLFTAAAIFSFCVIGKLPVFPIFRQIQFPFLLATTTKDQTTGRALENEINDGVAIPFCVPCPAHKLAFYNLIRQ